MQHIRSKDTKIEGLLRKALWKKGYRFRKNYKELPGKPDIVFTKYKIAIFAMESFSTAKIGKCLSLDWKRVIIVNIGLVKYPETKSGMMKSTRSSFFWDGR